MSASLLIPLPGNEALCDRMAGILKFDVGDIDVRRFPDGESYVRYRASPDGKDIILVCSLDRPDEKFLPLIFAADTARELGAGSIGLVAPYLAYMRQDRRFQPGEAVTSRQFAKLLTGAVDWLCTVDPHLHRYDGLNEIYSVPSSVGHAAPLLSHWIAREIERPLLVGPDGESEQWVAAVARSANAPFIVLEKIRRGDRDVEVSDPDVQRWRDRTPVLVDDIVSTARTMIETVRHLRHAGMKPPVCVAIHAVFSGSAYEDLRAAGVARVVTANTVVHPSNEIDVASLLADGVREMT